MARSRPHPSSRSSVATPGAPRAEVELRLAIGRDGIGLELAHPVALGCIRVVDVRTTLPGLRFPVDVSGGVNRFRHKRGELQHLRVELDARAIESWAPARLRGLMGERAPNVWLRVAHAQATLGVSDEREVMQVESAAPALAFELHVLADEDIVVVVSCARGVHLAATPTALAIACVEAMLGRYARRDGAEFTLTTPAAVLLRALLPDAGARAASARGVRWAIDADPDDRWTLRATREASLGVPTEAARRAQEAARILHRADDMLVAGDPERARAAYMEALERAPRHPEIVQRIADIDARVPGREEAVLGLMAESAEWSGLCPFGVTRSELLARVGRTDAALASFEQAVAGEPSPVLAGRLCELAAARAKSPADTERWLDRALAASPRALAARWARARNRLLLGRASEALGDVQHLDALSRGDRDRYEVWIRAGKAWQGAGFHAQAASLFERALLHVPDEPEALAGLGAALVETGVATRGTSLLARAFELAAERQQPGSSILLTLARALADHLGDFPAAIARVSTIPREAPEAIVALGLEGRWRARLGDLAGASLAFAAMRDMASSLSDRARDDAPGATEDVLGLLLEAEAFENEERQDTLAADGHAAAARRLRPAKAAPRQAADRISDVDPPAPEALSRWSLGAEPEVSTESAEHASRVEDLIRRFQANPDDHAVATELSGLLESLGRSHELLALLSARLDDAAPDERAGLVPRVRATLERLADGAERAGRSEEASLYRSALGALVG